MPPYRIRRSAPLSSHNCNPLGVRSNMSATAAAPAGARSGTPARRPGVVLAVILVTQLMVILDGTVVNIAMPHIQQALHFSPSSLSWVQNAYALAFGGLLLLGARAGDLLGRRRVFVAGLALFTAASLAAGLAQSAEWLVAARAAQGVAASFAIPSTLALLVANYPDPAGRTRAIALYSAVIGAG